ncbi:Slp family lipoprotein [Gallaecimonas sp. GXIMD4217]|uniref:Slp family lipoprotein n=1 Tax=Gallaecimonas sp. GXIMD4217 TaxID=3131927 RepID=UPI00311AF88C
MKALLTAVALLLLAGCSTIPDELAVPEGQSLAAYSAARQGAEQGKLVRWGGIIAQVDNLKNRTRLEVVYYPLSSSAKPKQDEASPGRFLAYLDGFVDPVVLGQGRRITVVGSLGRQESGRVGEFEYRYPTVQVQRYKLWKEDPDYDVYYVDPWPYWRYPGWHYPYYHRRHFAHDPFFAPNPKFRHKHKPKEEKKQ